MMGDDNHFLPARIIQRLQNRLQARADPEFQGWFKDYLKDVIRVRGVRMQEIRYMVHAWNQEWSMEQQDIPHETQTAVALQLMTSPYIEDKFASIIYMSEVLVVNERYSISNFDSFESLFSLQHIDNFKVCDHFSQKVLTPLVTQVGSAVATRLRQWFDSPHIYQARAALGALSSFAADGVYQDAILEGAAKLLRRQEEDGKSIAGSALRALGKCRPELVDEFLCNDENLGNHNAASLLKATDNLSQERTRYFRTRRRQLLQTVARTDVVASEPVIEEEGPIGQEASMPEGAILSPQMLEGIREFGSQFGHLEEVPAGLDMMEQQFGTFQEAELGVVVGGTFVEQQGGSSEGGVGVGGSSSGAGARVDSMDSEYPERVERGVQRDIEEDSGYRE